MAEWQHVTLEECDNVVVVRINRPDARNAFSLQTIDELADVARRLRRRADVRAVVLTGSDQFFSAGQDLNAGTLAPETLIERRTRALAGPDLLVAWEGIEAVTIAAMEGYCIGGACALTLVCDFRIMAASATMRLPEVALGMNMPWHTVPRLTALIGPPRAKQMLLFGKPVGTDRALAWGLADATAEDGQALVEALRWAAEIAALPPVPVRMTKEAVNVAAGANRDAVSFMDRDQYLLVAASEDLKEGIQAFRERRTPRFRGN